MDLFTHPPTHTLVSMPIIQNQKYQSPVAPNMSRLLQPQKQVRVYFRTYLFLHPLPLLNRGEGARRLKEKETWNCRQ